MKLIKRIPSLAFVVLSMSTMGVISSAMAQAQPQKTKTAQDLYQRGLAATCANCHGTDGKGVENL